MTLPYRNPALPVESRIADLLARLSLDEKIGQMTQANDDTPANRQLVRAGRMGSVLNIAGSWAPDLVKIANLYQRLAVEESPHGIPLLIGRDVIHGCRTILPIPLAQAASFDTALVEEGAAMAAAEARAYGIQWAFAPMVDIARDPRWGRIAEGGGEDPLLSGRMGAATVRGFQGATLSADTQKLAACAKHYVGYGAAEGGRDYNTTWIHDLLLRNVYLPPFRACVDAGVASMMSAFNCLNGVPASGNSFTIRQILKQEWGFDGLVVSDWDSIREMINHGYAADRCAAAEAGVRAGVDMEMVSTTYGEWIPALLKDGRITLAQVDDAVARILRIKFRLGLFEHPYTDENQGGIILSAPHRTIARKMAAECCVLLKNDGVLPLRLPLRSLAVIGPLADNGAEQMGCWSMDGHGGDSVTVVTALRDRLGKSGVVHEVPGLPDARSVDTGAFAAAVAAARDADAVVLVLGEPAYLSGEAHSRASLDLPGAQQQLLEAVAASGKPLILIVMAGRPLVLTPVLDKVAAVLWAWHPGTMGGPALADLLFGDAAPCGRLPVSMPACLGQVPVYYAQFNTGRPAPETTQPVIPEGTPLNPVGFTSSYVDASHRPLFPFGFGLGYTTFAYANIALSATRLQPGQKLQVSCDITNTGTREGVEVAQLYLRDEAASVVRPLRELKDFQRVCLAPGKTQRVTFTLTPHDLSFLDAAGKEAVEPGRFQVWIGGDARAQLGAAFELEKAEG